MKTKCEDEKQNYYTNIFCCIMLKKVFCCCRWIKNVFIIHWLDSQQQQQHNEKEATLQIVNQLFVFVCIVLYSLARCVCHFRWCAWLTLAHKNFSQCISVHKLFRVCLSAAMCFFVVFFRFEFESLAFYAFAVAEKGLKRSKRARKAIRTTIQFFYCLVELTRNQKNSNNTMQQCLNRE